MYTIALFGEAERGEFRTAYFCRNLMELDEFFGHPPSESRGLFYAVQALLFGRNLIYFRIHEEGFSVEDYLVSLKILESQQRIPQLDALCLPGVGDEKIIEAFHLLSLHYHSILITNEADFYDYLTSTKRNG